jgi:hypothetical protein
MDAVSTNPDAAGDSRVDPDAAEEDADASIGSDDSSMDASASEDASDAGSDEDSSTDSAMADSGSPDSADAAMDASMDASASEDASDAGSGEDSNTDSAIADSGSPDSADAAMDASGDDGATDAGSEAGAMTPGYTVTRMAGGASCDTPDSWTDTGLAGDDSTLDAPEPLPFSLSFYGDRVTHWSAASNGFAELWNTDSEIPSDSYRNEMLPTREVNGSIVAPFWDDLFIVPGASVRTATLGTAPARRFVIEWNNVSTIDRDETLRFQVKFFETSNVIEFHYCSLTTRGMGTRHTGDQATVGMQNLSQTVATNVSHNAVNAVETGLLLRFTPR